MCLAPNKNPLSALLQKNGQRQAQDSSSVGVSDALAAWDLNFLGDILRILVPHAFRAAVAQPVEQRIRNAFAAVRTRRICDMKLSAKCDEHSI